MKDLDCPYCDHRFDYTGDPMGDEEETEQECPECFKYFVVTSSLTINYNTHKAPCLNGAPHDLKMSTTYPREFSKLRCTYCSHYEKPTKEQMEELLNE